MSSLPSIRPSESATRRCGQRSSKTWQSPALSFQTTSCLPRMVMAVGRFASMSAMGITGYLRLSLIAKRFAHTVDVL